MLANEISSSYEGIVEEIASCIDLPADEVRHRVWMEALDLGWNVLRDVEFFHVRPYVFDDRMLELYRQGDGFIFETMVFWSRPYRQKWTAHAIDRIRMYADRKQVPLSSLRVLMMGDGCGSDSLALAEHGIPVDYFDIPGSKTFEFAVRRFRKHGVLDNGVSIVTRHEDCLKQIYDATLSFEVLEHLPDPQAAVQDMFRCLKQNGIALLTEAFGGVAPAFPTHLKSNLRFCGKLPLMCHRSGLLLTWASTDPAQKPLEFVKVAASDLPNKAELLRSQAVRTLLLSGIMNRAKLLAKSILEPTRS